jgi:hypothetical protein
LKRLGLGLLMLLLALLLLELAWWVLALRLVQ